VKFPFQWLKEHLDTKASLQYVAQRLTMTGLEIDKVHHRGKDLEGFVVARVIKSDKHPDADKLSVCQVDNGSETVEVVCGAPNAKTGLVGVFAPSGSYIPGTGITLKPTEIRGVVSNGMLLSEREVNLSDDHDGIIELSDDAKPGEPAAEAMGLADPVIEIEITPNRGDCLGVRGVARDLAAAGVGVMVPLNCDAVPGAFESPTKVHLDFDADAQDACPYFVGRTIRGVNNAESPKWLKDKLTAVGLRPISALVDITNLMTMDLGRPLHVFDLAKVDGDLHVRLSKPGEKILALDGKEYELDSGMTVIADKSKVEALGGIIGGEHSGCTESTVDVFIESAYFNPVRTAMTGRKLNLMSDARYRFERGVDPAFLVDGMEIATRLILDLCGGEASELAIAGSEPDWQRDLTLRIERIETFGGIKIADEKITEILTALGFGVTQDSGILTVSVPSWRPDIVGENCLVEEVVRIFGYDNIPAVPMDSGGLPQPALSVDQRRRTMAKRLLAGRGLVEAVTYSFMNEAQAAGFGGVVDSVRLVNPISADLNVMRPSILPNLLAAVARNQARGIEDPALFELGPQYADDTPEGQTLVAAGVRAGFAAPRHWTARSEAVDAFHAKADVMAALAIAGAPVDNLTTDRDVPGWYHPGRAGALRLGKAILACFGEINPRIAASFDVDGPLVGFEIFLDALPPRRTKGPAKKLLQLSALQPVHRDFAFIVDEAVAAADLVRAVKSGGGALLTDVSLFDVYRGKGVEDGKKSLAIAVTLQPVEATLTDDEIEAIATGIIASVVKRTGGILRG